MLVNLLSAPAFSLLVAPGASCLQAPLAARLKCRPVPPMPQLARSIFDRRFDSTLVYLRNTLLLGPQHCYECPQLCCSVITTAEERGGRFFCFPPVDTGACCRLCGTFHFFPRFTTVDHPLSKDMGAGGSRRRFFCGVAFTLIPAVTFVLFQVQGQIVKGRWDQAVFL